MTGPNIFMILVIAAIIASGAYAAARTAWESARPSRPAPEPPPVIPFHLAVAAARRHARTTDANAAVTVVLHHDLHDSPTIDLTRRRSPGCAV